MLMPWTNHESEQITIEPMSEAELEARLLILMENASPAEMARVNLELMRLLLALEPAMIWQIADIVRGDARP